MPIASLGSSYRAAFEHVKESLEDLNGRDGVSDTDIIFLKNLMDNRIVQELVKVQDSLEDTSTEEPQPFSTNTAQLTADIVQDCRGRAQSHDSRELANILEGVHFLALLKSHDTIAEKDFDPTIPVPEVEVIELPPVNGMPADSVRMVGLRRNPNEPLGITVRAEKDHLVIARILGGGMIDRQGLLHVGDIILEVNGREVFHPEELMKELSSCGSSVNLKIIPTCVDQAPTPQVISTSVDTGNTKMCYMRALFSYDPVKDTLLPCSDIGLKFDQGDILQIVNQSDLNWWQAKKVGANGPAGLVPSQELEERRKAFVKPEHDYVHKTGMCGTKVSKKKIKTMYKSKTNGDFDKAELLLYEEVVRSSPFQRRTLVLVGPQRVGRRTLKNRLVQNDPSHFATVLPHTSRPIREEEVEGKVYHFVSRTEMEKDIKNHKYLEYGETHGNLYGVKLDSIRQVIRSGKMCVLDCSPQAIKLLHNSEFLPYVVFIAAPGMDQLKNMNGYGKNMGSNRNFDRSFRYSSRRARTLESLASLYEEEDLRSTLEDSAKMQRCYEKYCDLVLTNEDFDLTFHKLCDAVENLKQESQWIPVHWMIY